MDGVYDIEMFSFLPLSLFIFNTEKLVYAMRIVVCNVFINLDGKHLLIQDFLRGLSSKNCNIGICKF